MLQILKVNVYSRHASRPAAVHVCRGTQVYAYRESDRSVPWPNVGNQKFSMRSFNDQSINKSFNQENSS